jgi:hypothetical protein
VKKSDQAQLRFKSGDRVRILDLGKAGHVRTPFYVRHKIGEIVDFRGCFLNPEQLSIGDAAGPVVPLYRVEFLMKDLWPDYDAMRSDVLSIEIYDHWLSPAENDEAQPTNYIGDCIGSN